MLIKTTATLGIHPQVKNVKYAKKKKILFISIVI